MIIYFSDGLLSKAADEFSLIESTYAEKFVSYMIHSDYTVAVDLKPWIKNVSNNLSPSVLSFVLLGSAPDGKYDNLVVSILGEVINKLQYRSDQQDWHMPEYWQTPLQTVQLGAGDCEDGAILLYALCRAAGVPADRMWICAADVTNPGNPSQTTGHCFLMYRPDHYPMNFVILDWCYWPSFLSIPQRHMFDVIGNVFVEQASADQTHWNQVKSNYKTAWFFFNEDKSTLSLKYSFSL